MAVQSIAVPADPKRDARALDLLPLVGTWPRHTLKVDWGSFEAGTTFRRATGSRGARYLVNAVACECPDYQESGNICKHVRAVALFEASQDADRTSRQIPGAEHVVTATSHRPCARKCGATLPPESRLRLCDPCYERIASQLANL